MNIEKEDSREKFTTTLKKSVKDKLSKLAPYYKGGNSNDVIEYLVEKEWEAYKNDMATTRGYNRG